MQGGGQLPIRGEQGVVAQHTRHVIPIARHVICDPTALHVM